MSAFQDSGHRWWMECEACGMAWHVGEKPEGGRDAIATCERCQEPSPAALQRVALTLYAEMRATPTGADARTTRAADLRVLERAGSGLPTAAEHDWPKGFRRGEVACQNEGCTWTREAIRAGPNAGIYFRKVNMRGARSKPGACTGREPASTLPPEPPTNWTRFLVEVAFAPRCNVDELSDDQVTEMVARFLPTAPDSDFSGRLLVGKRKPSG